MMVTKVKHPKKQIFPSMTLCRGIINEFYKSKNVSEAVEYNWQLENWLNSTFDGIVGLKYEVLYFLLSKIGFVYV